MTALTTLRWKDHAPWLVLLAGLCALYVPTLVSLFSGVWADDTQGHGPIILALACWLIYKRWDQVDAVVARVAEALTRHPAASRYRPGDIL